MITLELGTYVRELPTALAAADAWNARRIPSDPLAIVARSAVHFAGRALLMSFDARYYRVAILHHCCWKTRELAAQDAERLSGFIDGYTAAEFNRSMKAPRRRPSLLQAPAALAATTSVRRVCLTSSL